MVTYDASDALRIKELALQDLPQDWRHNEALTQEIGNSWHNDRACSLLRVQIVIVSIATSPDVNVVINHTHPDASAIQIVSVERFALDPRLFRD